MKQAIDIENILEGIQRMSDYELQEAYKNNIKDVFVKKAILRELHKRRFYNF